MRWLGLLLGVVLTFALSPLSLAVAAEPMPQAPKQKAPTRLTLSAAAADASTVVLNGTLAEAGNKPVAGALVLLVVDAGAPLPVMTGPDGAYSARLPAPAAGNHMAQAGFRGDALRNGATASAPFAIAAPAAPVAPVTGPSAVQAAPAALTSVLTGTLTPSPVPANGTITVAGKLLTSANQPIDQAKIDLSSSYGGATAVAVTASDGGFSATLALPDTPAAPLPTAVTVTAGYAGDGRFPATTATFTAPLAGAASKAPVVQPTIATQTPLPSISAPTATASTRVAAAGAADLNAGMTKFTRTVGLVLLAVAVAGLMTLGTMWVLAWRRHGLVGGERRGFGTDFGRPFRR